MSIRYMYEKFKSSGCGDTLYIATLLLLVGVISFGLGRQSVVETLLVVEPAGVIFSDVPAASEAVLGKTPAPQKEVVVSKFGTKYHLLTCSGAQRINEENKVYFQSAALAQAAGYEAASNCPGI